MTVTQFTQFVQYPCAFLFSDGTSFQNLNRRSRFGYTGSLEHLLHPNDLSWLRWRSLPVDWGIWEKGEDKILAFD
jgi:hypothetical protein